MKRLLVFELRRVMNREWKAVFFFLFFLPSDKWIKMQMDCSLLENGGEETVILFKMCKNVKLHFLASIQNTKKTLEATLCIFFFFFLICTHDSKQRLQLAHYATT